MADAAFSGLPFAVKGQPLLDLSGQISGQVAVGWYHSGSDPALRNIGTLSGNSPAIQVVANETAGTGIAIDYSLGVSAIVSGMDAADLPGAVQNNDYAAYSFTTAAAVEPGTSITHFQSYGGSVAYKIALFVSSDHFASATLLGMDMDGGGSRNINIPDFELMPATTYEVRVYFYAADASPVTWDDFRLNVAVDPADYSTVFNEGGAASPIGATGTAVEHPFGLDVMSAEVVLTNPQPGDRFLVGGKVVGDGSSGSLNGIAYSVTSSGGTIRVALNGQAASSVYALSLRQIAFHNTLDAPSLTPRRIESVVSDGSSVSPLAVTTVSVGAVNDAPVNTLPGLFNATEDTDQPLNGISVSDPDAADGAMTLTLQVASGSLAAAAGGGVSVSGGGSSVLELSGRLEDINALLSSAPPVFTPALNVNGNVTLTITSNDNGNTGSGGARSDTDVRTIRIAAANDPPVANPDTVSVTEDHPASGNVLDNDLDVDGDTIVVTTFTVAGISGTFNPGQTATVGGVGALTVAASGAFTFTPDADYAGAVPVSTYHISDGHGGSAFATLTIGPVTPVNDPPINTLPASLTTDEDTPLTLTGFAVQDVDAGSGLITVTLQVNSGSLSASGVAGVTVAGAGSSQIALGGTVSAVNAWLASHAPVFNPAANMNGSVSLRLFTNDNGHTGSGGALTDTDFCSITINAVNDPPVAENDSKAVVEDTPVSGNVLVNDTDVENDPLKVTAFRVAGIAGSAGAGGSVSMPGIGQISIAAGGVYSFVPHSNYNGAVPVVTYAISDGHGGSDEATLTLGPIEPVNDPPVITSDGGGDEATVDVPENRLLATDVNADDVDGDTLDYTIAGGADADLLTQDRLSGLLLFKSAPDFEAPADADGDNVYEVVVLVEDGHGGSDLQTLHLRITDVLEGDSDGDGIPDAIDLDDDNDGVPDTIELASALHDGDTDGDGVPDVVDLDSDNDGIPDAMEAGHRRGDADGDGRVDGPFGGNGLCDALETADTPDASITYLPWDTDGDGRMDRVDLDSDNDGINDVREASGADADGDGRADGAVSLEGIPATAVPPASVLPDVDSDGHPDVRDLDSDNDGINDVIENGGVDDDLDGIVDGDDADGDGLRSSADGTPGLWGDGSDPEPRNGDNDRVPNFRDLDSDNDSIPDVIEGGTPDADSDKDGTIDPADTGYGDSDGDGIADAVDESPAVFGDAGGFLPPDADGTGGPDYLDLDRDDNGWSDLIEGGRDPDIYDVDGDGQLDSLIKDDDDDGISDGGGIDITPSIFGGILPPVPGVDSDDDGVPDVVDLDDDNDGIPDRIERLTALNGGDTDRDGVPDVLDLDSDNDHLLDIVEAGHGEGDADGNGRVDVACGINGLADTLETDDTPKASITYDVLDADGDGLPDFQDVDMSFLPGSPVPGMEPDRQFQDWFDFSLNAGGRVIMHGVTVGKVRNINKDEGVWSTATGRLEMLVRESDPLPGAKAGKKVGRRFQQLRIGDQGVAYFMSDAKTGSVVDDIVGWVDNGTGVIPYARKDTIFSTLYYGACQGISRTDAWFTATRKRGGGVTAANDMGIWHVTANGGLSLAVAEGDRVGSGVSLGTLITRLVVGSSGKAVYPSYLLGVPSSQNLGLFCQDFGAGGAPELLVEKGSDAPGVPGGKFALFLGESVNGAGAALFEASLALSRSAGVTSTNDTGLWSNRSGDLELIVREGDLIEAAGAGVALARIDSHWLLDDGSVVLCAALRGPGVTALNDLCVLHVNLDGSADLLVRERQALDHVGGAVVSAIQRVDVAPNGCYVVLASLVSGVAGTRTGVNDQVLYTGDLATGELPIVIRKGDDYLINGSISKRISLIQLSGTTTTSAGGTGGHGRFVNESGQVIFKLGFSDPKLAKGLFVRSRL